MTMPKGQFWAWRTSEESWCIQKATVEPESFNLTHAESVDLVSVFLHIFGVVPEPGQAMKLDARAFERVCSTCAERCVGVPLVPLEGDDTCPHCGSPWLDKKWHATILATKSLEGSKT